MKNDISTKKETVVPTPVKRSPFPSLLYALLGRLSVILICLAIAVTTAMGMAACERVEADPIPTETSTETPSDTAETPPYAQRDGRFTFGYDPYLGNLAYHGSLIYLNTWVINEGDPFTYEGSSTGFAPTATLVHKENGYRIQGDYAVTDDIVRFTINPKDKGQAGQVFSVPLDAPVGVYDLELSYGGESATLPGVLTVATSPYTDTIPPILQDGHPFSFRYEPLGGFVIPGDRIEITTQVINEGDPFTFEGSSYNGYAPDAFLIHRESGYRIQGGYWQTDDIVRFPVNTGDVGEVIQEFWFEADVPTGDYDLYLSFNDQEQIFENVLTVAIP